MAKKIKVSIVMASAWRGIEGMAAAKHQWRIRRSWARKRSVIRTRENGGEMAKKAALA